MYASVYPDGSTAAVYIGRISAVTSTTITIDATNNAGSAPTDGTGDRTVKIGGAFDHPSRPLTLANRGRLYPASGNHRTRFNVKAGTYSVASVITLSSTGDDNSSRSFHLRGYTTTPGDGGRFRLEGSSSGAAYTLLDLNSRAVIISDFEIGINGSTGSAALITNGVRSALINGKIGPSRSHGHEGPDGINAIRCLFFDCLGVGNRSFFGNGVNIECLFRNCQHGTLYVPAINCVFDNMTTSAHEVSRGALCNNTYIQCPTVFGGGIVGDTFIKDCLAVNCTTLFASTNRRAYVFSLYHWGTTNVYGASADDLVEVYGNITALASNPLTSGGNTGSPRTGNWTLATSSSLINQNADAIWSVLQDSTYSSKVTNSQIVAGANWPIISGGGAPLIGPGGLVY